jgi:hypothetical protein
MQVVWCCILFPSHTQEKTTPQQKTDHKHRVREKCDGLFYLLILYDLVIICMLLVCIFVNDLKDLLEICFIFPIFILFRKR